MKPACSPSLVITASVAVFSAIIHTVVSSEGDRSYIFTKCMGKCDWENCNDIQGFIDTQPSHLKALQWSCEDECKYNCMWHTVQAFEDDGSEVPQFFGKWPFIRFAGIQEPGSMIFSLLNALSHLAILYFRAKVPSSTPMYKVWHGIAAVGIITWTCAALFHTRDFPFTEKLDYFSAFGLVLFNLFTLIARVNVGRDPRLLCIPAFLLALIYVYHVQCLCHHFDYGYNMMVNVAAGAVNGLGWISWCWYQYRINGKPYVLNGAAVVVVLSLLVALELLDFPPLFWTFDAHAFWHAGTVPLTLLWYRFIIQDSLELIGKDDTSFKKMV